MLAMLFSAALLLAWADTTTSGAAAQADQAKPKNKDMELVCWRETPAGTHFSKQVCAPRIQREQMEKEGQAAIGQHPRAAPAASFGH